MKLRSLLCALISIGIASSVFANQRVIDAGCTVITVKDPESISWSRLAAYRTASSAYEFIEGKMLETSIQAYLKNDRNYQDKKFQMQKSRLNKMLTESMFGIKIFADTQIDIVNDGFGNSYTFFFPKINLAALGILQTDNIDTVENASVTLGHINTAIDKINAFFPSDVLLSSMKAFASKTPLSKTTVSGGEIIINGTDSVDTILLSLTSNKAFFMLNLRLMQKLAQEVIMGRAGDTKSFDKCISNLDLNLQLGSVAAKIFNGGSFTVRDGDEVKRYDMPKLSTITFHFDNDSLTNDKTIRSSITHEVFALFWLRDWVVTGRTPTFEIQDVSSEALLETVFGKLSKEDQATVIKMINEERMSH